MIQLLKRAYKSINPEPSKPKKKSSKKGPKYSATIRANAKILEKDIRRLVDEGAIISEMKSELNISHTSLSRYMKYLGIKPNKKRKISKKDPRANMMKAMRHEGKTLSEIGKSYSITRERVRQILSKNFPEELFPTIAVKTKECPCCGKRFTGTSRPGGFCSKRCSNISNGTMKKWNRTEAEKIMELRDKNLTWSDIAIRFGMGDKSNVFRASIQKQIRILFNEQEQERYFPPRTLR